MNKIKVLVVDDERLARESLKITIDWESYGCIIIGEASDAFEAIAKARELRPDIIVTDIKMPGMDGLDMIEKIMAFNPCNFIVVTGYDDFKYAKRAIKIHAMDFILKPIDTKEFEGAVQKAVLECRKAKEQQDVTREKLLLDILRGRRPFYDLLENENVYKIRLDRFSIALIQNDSFEEPYLYEQISTLYEQNQIISSKVSQILGNDIYLVECHEDRLAAIIPQEIISCDKLFQRLSILQQEVRKYAEITLSIGISKENSVDNIKTAYEQAKTALENRFYAGKGSITFFKDIENEGNKDIEFKGSIKNEILLTLEACDRKQLANSLEVLYLKTLKGSKANMYLIKQMSLEIIGAATELLKDYNIDEDDIVGPSFTPYQIMRNLNTVDEIYDFVKSTLMKILMAIREYISDASESGIKKALDYISQNYTENISLCDVANYVHHNESYLSRKIKETIGMTFVQYLTKLRMEKAIELLQNPNALIQEVAQQVGYTDYRYFSLNFKKYTGYSPKEFSKKNK
ncbi:MAG: response regulator [Tepidanaerobacter acetatoxydans]|uniref:response regulator n=1 Tax=Tepidanaerobacter acetatoxydans TaxID=499229 RepID=UPI0026F0D51A|nr:response regulator [Tepidanaerobacter acetatoxydans]NLU09652.1 response regulator [Tepidanaerobacter acetatoxydans]